MLKVKNNMTILGIETATERLSTALVIGNNKSMERNTDSRSSHCELLTGFIMEMIDESGITHESIDGISVSIGPGSFTGLRIGIATAMGMAYGLGIDTVPVSTLAALAWKATDPGTLVCPLIDAKRQEAYAAVYRITKHIPEILFEPAAMPVDKLGELLLTFDEKVIVNGPSADLFKDKLTGICGDLLTFILPQFSKPSALAVAELGELLFRNGGGMNPALLEPLYLRRSDAELIRDKRSAGS